jgi:iron(III) transport system substrate-binding protein
MIRGASLGVAAAAAAVPTLPFALDRRGAETAWRPGDPVLVVISPHNEAIRAEFGSAFSDWHAQHFGAAVKVDWRTPGGTTEIMRYLDAQYAAARRAAADPAAVTCKIDILFGGGVYDHGRAARKGYTVPAALPGPPGFPRALSGEIWRSETYFGTCLSTFGICYNPDRLAGLGITDPPARWADLGDPRYRGRLGLADPTKSGSIAKCFEMLIQERCAAVVRAAGFGETEIDRYETALQAGPPASASVPAAYQAAVERGWLDGLNMVRRLGANARYFTDASGQVPIDVATGNAAAGLAIDFYARTQAEVSRGPNGEARLVFVAPAGGTSVSADPISLLRGAPHPETARRFMTFVLSEAGQRLWTYRPGTPGGPRRAALRRMPILRSFYPSQDPVLHAAHERHRVYAADPLEDPAVNPYALAEAFTYRPRWTARHFGVHRDLIRAMCMDAGDELRAAWAAIAAAGGPERCPAAMALLERMPDRPEPFTWADAPTVGDRFDRMDVQREWAAFFRRSYREALSALKPET